jgi:hypothetical protein
MSENEFLKIRNFTKLLADLQWRFYKKTLQTSSVLFVR